MDTVFVVYKTDDHHSFASRDIIGVTKTRDMAIYICKQQAEKEGERLGKGGLFNLNAISQTQGYDGDGEFHFEELDLDVLI